jgi:hypothetical protein
MANMTDAIDADCRDLSRVRIFIASLVDPYNYHVATAILSRYNNP